MDLKRLLGLLPFTLSVFLAIACVIIYHFLRQRRMRRSPLADRQIGHVPGQQLVEQASNQEVGALSSMMLMYLSLPLMFMVWIGTRVDLTVIKWGGTAWIFLIAALLMFGYGLLSYIRHLNAYGNIRDGLLAERVAGMQLNRLVANGCFVMHDLPCEGFNIDHVVITPRSVYAVETKSFRKPRTKSLGESPKVKFDGNVLDFGEFTTDKPIEQARRQAQWLARYLREALGEPIPVSPAVALPGWYVERTEGGKASDIFVFTPMGRGYEWFTYGTETIPATKLNLIAKALATRYPTIS